MVIKILFCELEIDEFVFLQSIGEVCATGLMFKR